MSLGLVRPVEIGRFQRFLLSLKADCRGPHWLRRWAVGEDDQSDLFSQIVRSVCSEPNEWTPGPHGLTNLAKQIGVYAAEGAERVAVAVDADKQFFPSAYWRWLLFEAVEAHRDYTEAKTLEALGFRF